MMRPLLSTQTMSTETTHGISPFKKPRLLNVVFSRRRYGAASISSMAR